MAGTVQVRAHLPFGTRERLAARMAQEKAARRAILAEPEWQIPPGTPAEERARIRARARARIRHLREAGELCDTIDVLVRHAVRTELAARGWDRPWPAPPPHAPRSGRWPGSRSRAWPESISARLPSHLAARLYRACWHASAPAIADLRTWRDDHPEVITARTTPALYTQYQRLAGQVTTPGDVLRAAIARALST